MLNLRCFAAIIFCWWASFFALNLFLTTFTAASADVSKCYDGNMKTQVCDPGNELCISFKCQDPQDQNGFLWIKGCGGTEGEVPQDSMCRQSNLGPPIPDALYKCYSDMCNKAGTCTEACDAPTTTTQASGNMSGPTVGVWMLIVAVGMSSMMLMMTMVNWN